MPRLNETHDPVRKSWIDSANAPDSDFPIQNLPFGVFSNDAGPRVGVAIGDQILDLAALNGAGLLDAKLFDQPSLNPFMAKGPAVWRRTRRALSDLLERTNGTLRDDAALRGETLVAQAGATLHLPFSVTSYTDFYASKEHAANVGSMFRDPKNALTPNWLHIPIGYNGRASTVVVSGTDVRRPLGQIKPPDADAPLFSPSRKLDIELEVGAIVGAPNPMGQPVTLDQAEEMIFGFVLLNDWSARDIQAWEYQPLGPFQSKAFATTISPWVVTREALAPFRVDTPAQDPTPLPYLRQIGPGNIDLHLSARLRPEGAGADTTICETNFRYMYWSTAQQLTHHAVSGCAMRTGDLLGSGTISGATEDSFGSLLERTWNGKTPITLEGGGARTFIEDGDTLTLAGHCQGDGFRVGFGEAVGKILPAPSMPDWS